MDHGQYSQLQNDQYIGVSVDAGSYSGSGYGDRILQWSNEETRDFLVIRAELDPDFMETKRNKPLWELVSTRMSEIGYNRTSIQCKCKWKNLVTRYKGCESMEEMEMRQRAFPFYNDMQTIFNARMQRMMWQEGGAASSSPAEGGGRRKRKEKEKAAAGNSGGEGSCSRNSPSSVVEGLKGIMEEFMRQQMEMEMQWIRAYEEREERRREREVEWRRRMEALEGERVRMMRFWREREEERKRREEARAERRDALVTRGENGSDISRPIRNRIRSVSNSV